MAIKGTIVPSSAMEIAVDQVYFHCGRSILPRRPVDPEKKVGRDAFPTLGVVLADQIAGVERGDRQAARGRLHDQSLLTRKGRPCGPPLLSQAAP